MTNQAMESGYVQSGVSRSITRSVDVEGGMKYNNRGYAQYIQGSLGQPFASMPKVNRFIPSTYSGNIMFSNQSINERRLEANFSFQVDVAGELSYNSETEKFEFESKGLGPCCSVSGSLEYTGKFYQYTQPVPYYTSRPLEEVYGR